MFPVSSLLLLPLVLLLVLPVLLLLLFLLLLLPPRPWPVKQTPAPARPRRRGGSLPHPLPPRAPRPDAPIASLATAALSVRDVISVATKGVLPAQTALSQRGVAPSQQHHPPLLPPLLPPPEMPPPAASRCPRNPVITSRLTPLHEAPVAVARNLVAMASMMRLNSVCPPSMNLLPMLLPLLPVLALLLLPLPPPQRLSWAQPSPRNISSCCTMSRRAWRATSWAEARPPPS